MAIKHIIRSKINYKTIEVDLTPIKAIRFQCIECMGHQSRLVDGCTDILCPLYPYRMGKKGDPLKKGSG